MSQSPSDRPPGVPLCSVVTEARERTEESSSNLVESHPSEHFQDSKHSSMDRVHDRKEGVVAMMEDRDFDIPEAGCTENETANALDGAKEITDSGAGRVERMGGWESAEERTARELEEARKEYQDQVALRRKSTPQALSTIATNSQLASRITNPIPKPHNLVYVYRFEIPSPQLTKWLIGSGGELCRRVRKVAQVDVLYLDRTLAHRLPFLVQSKPVGLVQGTIEHIQNALKFIKQHLEGCQYQWRSRVGVNTNTLNFLDFLDYKPERLLDLTSENDLTNLHKAGATHPAHFSPVSQPPDLRFPVHQNRLTSTFASSYPPYQPTRLQCQPQFTSTKRSRSRSNSPSSCSTSSSSRSRDLSPQIKRQRPSFTQPPPQGIESSPSESEPRIESPPPVEIDLEEASFESDLPKSTALSFNIPLTAASAFFGPTSSLPHLERVTGTKLKLECETTTARIAVVSGFNQGVPEQEKIDQLRVGIEETVQAVSGESYSIPLETRGQDRAHSRKGSLSKTPTPTNYPSPVSLRQHYPPVFSRQSQSAVDSQQMQGRKTEAEPLDSRPFDASSKDLSQSPYDTVGRSRSTTVSQEEEYRCYRRSGSNRHSVRGGNSSLSRDYEETRRGRSRSPPPRRHGDRRNVRLDRVDEIHSRTRSRPPRSPQASPLPASASSTRSSSITFTRPHQRVRPYVSPFVSNYSPPREERTGLRQRSSFPQAPRLQSRENDRYVHMPSRPRSRSRLPSLPHHSRSSSRFADSPSLTPQISPPIHLTITEEERRILQKREEGYLFEQKMRGEGRWRFEGPSDPTERYRWARGGDWSKLREVEDERRFENRVENQKGFEEEIKRRREKDDRERGYAPNAEKRSERRSIDIWRRWSEKGQR